MDGGGAEGELSGRPMAPDPRLVEAAAMVFVSDLGAPTIDLADARHLLDVLRLRPGEPVVVADGSGSWVPCRIAPGTAGRSGRSCEPGSIVAVDGNVEFQPESQPQLTVAFAPTKGDRPEWVVQKLTELGIDAIVPLRAQRSVVRWEGERAERAVERLRRVAREAAAQSRRLRLPAILPVVTPGELMGRFDAGGLDGKAITALALAVPGGGRLNVGHRTVVIGPEGGWDDTEQPAGVSTVGLGPTVLRAETAAVAAGVLLCAFRHALVAPLA